MSSKLASEAQHDAIIVIESQSIRQGFVFYLHGHRILAALQTLKIRSRSIYQGTRSCAIEKTPSVDDLCNLEQDWYYLSKNLYNRQTAFSFFLKG